MHMLTAAAKGQRIEYRYDHRADDDTLVIEALAHVTPKHSEISLQSFIAGACEYLETKVKQLATVGTPFVAYEANVAPLEFTAAIRITGERRGTVYLTASRAMLTIMLMRMGSTDVTAEHMSKVLRDLAMSMVNAARRDLSDELLVWEPSVATERTGKIECARDARPLIVPIHWRKFTAQLVMCME